MGYASSSVCSTRIVKGQRWMITYIRDIMCGSHWHHDHYLLLHTIISSNKDLPLFVFIEAVLHWDAIGGSDMKFPKQHYVHTKSLASYDTMIWH